MIPKEIFKQVKRIEIRTSHLVDSTFGGRYESVFKGKGIEFSEVREYYPGDDVRSIDWNVTARTGTPYIKVFHEERELTVIFAVDVSSSFHFGSGERLKSEIAAELCALLAFSAIKNNDKIGLLLFSDKIEKYIPLKKGKQHVLRVIREILFYKPENKGTNLHLALETLNRILNRSAVIFIISDFLAANYERPMKLLARDHDVIAIHIFDPRERSMPRAGHIAIEDAETGQNYFLDSNAPTFGKQYAVYTNTVKEKIDAFFRSKGIDKIDIDVTKSYIRPVRSFFEMREKRL